MFKFPENCVTPQDREAYCLRYQEYQHELSRKPILDGPANYGGIMEVQRVTRVAEMLPFIRAARKDSIEGNYIEGKEPLYLASKEDWDGEKIVLHEDFDLANKGAVLHHARRVMALNMASPDIDKISHEAGKAKMACLHDKTLDGDISNG